MSTDLIVRVNVRPTATIDLWTSLCGRRKKGLLATTHVIRRRLDTTQVPWVPRFKSAP